MSYVPVKTVSVFFSGGAGSAFSLLRVISIPSFEDLLSVGERWSVGSALRVLQAIQKVFK